MVIRTECFQTRTHRRISQRFPTAVSQLHKERRKVLSRKERDKLIRQYEANRATIATRENNIGFLNIGKSKEENPLVAEMLKNIEKLKADQVELVKKIKALEEKIKNAEEN